MDDLILHITGNQLFGIGSIISLVAITYLTRRYISNSKKTSNQYYIKSTSTLIINAISKIDKLRLCYICWNGDMSSTYLLIDALLQDKIIQPIYFESYKIAKNENTEYLETLTNAKQDINPDTKSNTNPDTKPQLKDIDIEFIKALNKMKIEQYNEMIKIDLLLKMIIHRYPEFKNNLLPVIYITNIEKDLDFTTQFYTFYKSIIKYNDKNITGIENILRFWKYYIIDNKMGFIPGTKLILGYNADTKNIKIINKIFNEMANVTWKYQLSGIKIDIPLENITINELKNKIVNSFIDADIYKIMCNK